MAGWRQIGGFEWNGWLQKGSHLNTVRLVINVVYKSICYVQILREIVA